MLTMHSGSNQKTAMQWIQDQISKARFLLHLGLTLSKCSRRVKSNQNSPKVLQKLRMYQYLTCLSQWCNWENVGTAPSYVGNRTSSLTAQTDE
eukprot:6474810-Amphidinium_carterae.1